ncbi:MAG: transcription elongation factor subunit Spt4 [Acidilobaceae archaeon]
MKPRRTPTKKPALKACKECGTLNPRESTACSSCGSTQFSDEWSGLIIVFDSQNSLLAKSAEISEPVVKAIRVAGKIMVKMKE